MTGTQVASTSAARRVGLALLLLTLVLLSAHFALNLQRNGVTFLDTDAYVRFEAKRPYQYRLLMAPVMNGLMQLFSQPRAMAVLADMPRYVSTPALAGYFVINTVSLSASILLMLALATRCFGALAARTVVAVYVPMVYVFFCLNVNLAFILPYDIASLALSQACLLALVSSRWRTLYALFVICTLNRETSFLVIILLASRAAFRAPAERRTMLAHAVALSVVWLAMKTALHFSFDHLDIDGGERITYNVIELSKPWQWPALMPLVACAALTFVSLRSRPRQPEWAVTGCIGFVMIFVVAQITETRSYADLMVFFSMAIGSWLVARAPLDRGSIERV